MNNKAPETLRFIDNRLHLIDQTRLPGRLEYVVCQEVTEVHDAIRRLVVRGAPAIGIAAAYGVCLASDEGQYSKKAALEAADFLATSRPTAVNLFWALDRMRKVIGESALDGQSLLERLIEEAELIHAEDRQMCQSIGNHGADLLSGATRVLTHCNAGSLATSVLGTALAPIYELHRRGQPIEVFADETRPLLQGSRLTAWELSAAGVPVTVLCDSAAGALLSSGNIDAVIVGSDRITAKGDVANKIGTYPLAVLANRHHVPVYVAAPTSTIDRSIDSGADIPIEQRSGEEVVHFSDRASAPEGVNVFNPAFDVTPAELVNAIITEDGVHRPPYDFQ